MRSPLHARAWLLTAPLALGCYSAAPYREPSVTVAPVYAAAARDNVQRSVVTGTPVRVADAAPAASSVRFNTAGQAAPFWRALGDSTLSELVGEALRTSPSVQSAEARLTTARASRRLAAFDLVPTVTATGSMSRAQQSIAAVPGLNNRLPTQDLYDVGFDATWELDIFGRTQRTIGAQQAFVSSSEHALDDVQVSLAAEVARTYFELRGAERQLAVARHNGENQQHTVALTQQRLGAGRGTAFDTERANSVLQLVRRRPDVLAAERRLAGSALLVGAAQADYLPRLTLGASTGYTSTQFRTLTTAGTSRLVVGPVLSFPLLDIGRVHQRVDIAAARQDDARAQYTAAVLLAVEEAETALVAYDRAHARVAILTEAVRSSTRAAELAEQRFTAGLTDFFQVLDAQRTVLDAESQLAAAHTLGATALVSVYKSVGGSWPAR